MRALGAGLALVVFLAGCGGDGSTTVDAPDGTDDTVRSGPEIVLEFDGGEFVGDVRREEITIGDQVTVTAAGERDEQIHLHGYDLYIEPDEAIATIQFDALIPGRFEIEFEDSGRLLVELTVS